MLFRKDVWFVGFDGTEIVIPAIQLADNIFRCATFDSRVGVLPGDRLITVTGADGRHLFATVDGDGLATTVVPAGTRSDIVGPVGPVYDDGDCLMYRCAPDHLDTVHPDGLIFDSNLHESCSPVSPEAFLVTFPTVRARFSSPTDLLWAILDQDRTLPVAFAARQPRFVSTTGVDDTGAYDALAALSVASLDATSTRTVVDGVEWTESIVSDGCSAAWIIEGDNGTSGPNVRAAVWASWVSEFGPQTLNIVCPVLAEPAPEWTTALDLVFQASRATRPAA